MNIKIEKRKLSELVPTKNNPRQIKKDDFERLKKSVKSFPKMLDIREIVIDESGTILGGHQRVKALLANGETEATVKIVEGLSDDEKREFVIRDNIQNGEWDFDTLANEWDDLPLDDWGVVAPLASGIVDDLRELKYPDKEMWFQKKPFLVIFYDQESKNKLEQVIGRKIETDTLDASNL